MLDCLSNVHVSCRNLTVLMTALVLTVTFGVPFHFWWPVLLYSFSATELPLVLKPDTAEKHLRIARYCIQSRRSFIFFLKGPIFTLEMLGVLWGVQDSTRKVRE